MFKLKVISPYDKRFRHPAQVNYFNQTRLRRKRHLDGKKKGHKKAGIQRINFHGGRGSGKSIAGVMDMVNVAMVEAPNSRTFWSEQKNEDIDRILITTLEEVVPSGLYKIISKKSGYRFIKWKSGHVTDLLSLYTDNKKKRPGLGGNVIGGWMDELATGFNQRKVSDIVNSIRQRGAPYYFLSTLSTPLPNGYQAMCEQEGAINIKSSSYDNPHLDKGAIDSMVSLMSPDQVKQEIFGEFVPVGGRIWKYFIDDIYPKGNLVPGLLFNYNQPWYLSVDLGGNQGSAGIWQEWNGKLVLLEEYLTNRMDFNELLDDVIKDKCYGQPSLNKPAMVWIGHDVNSIGSIIKTTAAMLLSKLDWEWSYPVRPNDSKEIQKTHFNNLLYRKEVLFSVKSSFDGRYVLNKTVYGVGQKRSALDVMRNDTYSEKRDAIFNKDKDVNGVHALEDTRDMMLYAGVLWHTPEDFVYQLKA